MPEIEHGLALETVEQTTGSAAFVSALTAAAGNFVPGATYLLLIIARINATSSFSGGEWRVVLGGNEMTGSLCRGEVRLAGFIKGHYGYMTVFTQPSPAEAIAFEFRNTTGSGLATADEIAIFWMRLDASLQAADWYFNEDDDSAAPTVHTTSFQDFASITFAARNDDWLILAAPSCLFTNRSTSAEYRINRDSDSEIAPLLSHETNTGDEQWGWLLSRVFTLSGAPHTFTVQGRDDGVLGGPDPDLHEHHSSRIFALRLDALRQHGFFWNEAGVARTAPIGVYQDVADVGLTPPVQADYLLLGTCINDAGNLEYSDGRLTLDGGVVGQGAGIVTQSVTYDATAEEPLAVMALENLDVSPHEILFQTSEGQSNGELEDRSLLVLSMELPEGDAAGVSGAMGPSLVRTPPRMVAY